MGVCMCVAMLVHAGLHAGLVAMHMLLYAGKMVKVNENVGCAGIIVYDGYYDCCMHSSENMVHAQYAHEAYHRSPM